MIDRLRLNTLADSSLVERVAGCVLCLLLLIALSQSAQAQVQPPARPALLTSISIADVGDGETEVVLSFGPFAPGYSIIKNDTDRLSIGFALSTRGSGAVVQNSIKGFVRDVSFEQNETILIVKLATSSPARITATPMGDKIISLRISALRAPKGASDYSSGLNTGPLPRAVDTDQLEDGFEVVPLKYADISEVVGLLTDGLNVKSNDTFTPTEPQFGSSGMGGASGYSQVPPRLNPDQEDQALGQSVNEAIGVDRRLNAIILKGTAERIARMKAKIALFDVPVESVLLETSFVELTETGSRNLGLDFNNSAGQIGVAAVQSGGFIPVGISDGHFLTSASFQAALYAEVRSGHGKIVSKPRIAAQSGSTAKIITGDAVPILTAITLSGVNAVSQQVQYVNVGVTLQIAPRVSSDGFVTSHMFSVVSSVTGYSQGYPTISQREAETSVTVRDGETFVIGGLTEKTDRTPLTTPRFERMDLIHFL